MTLLFDEEDKAKAESIRWTYSLVPTETLVGKEICKIVKTDGDMLLHTTDGHLYAIYHEQDCCEHVYLADVCGDLEDLVFAPIISFEIVSNREEPPINPSDESHTWTFVKASTAYGSVTMRWYGESNGWYSETVVLKELTPMIYKWGGNPRMSDRTRKMSDFIHDISETGVA